MTKQSLAIVSEFMLLELYVSKHNDIIMYGNGFIDNKFKPQHIIITIDNLKTIFIRATKTDIQLLSHEIEKSLSKTKKQEVIIDYNKIICHGYSTVDNNLIIVVEKGTKAVKLLHAKSITNPVKTKREDEQMTATFREFILKFYNMFEQYDLKRDLSELPKEDLENIVYESSYLAVDFSAFLQDFVVTDSIDEIV